MMIRDCQHLKSQHIRAEKNAFKVLKSEIMIVRDLFLEINRDCLFHDEINHTAITTKI